MNTYLEKITRALCKVEEACVFAQSKQMKRLIAYNKHCEMHIMLALFIPLVGGAAAILSVDMGWLSVKYAVLLVPLPVLLMFCAHILIDCVWLKKYKQQAQKSHVVVCENADQNASATLKMDVLDACEGIVAPTQMDALKIVAQREDVPLGWWQNIAKNIRDYKDGTIKQHKNHNAIASEQRAQERLALLTVSVADSSCENKNSKRLIV